MPQNTHLSNRRIPASLPGTRVIAMPRLKELREEYGITAKKMAKDLLVDISTIFRWEAGQASPHRQAQMMIIAYFDCAWEEIFTFVPSNRIKRVDNAE